MKSLDEWLDWQRRVHPEDVDLSLDRVAEVYGRLDTQAFSAKVFTIAGTNGKGSSVAMLESICLTAGYSVGSYTTPHLLNYNERIRVNGFDVDDAVLVRAFSVVEEARRSTTLTYFEFGTLAAMTVFISQALEVVILEVGLGGRLDAVNVVDSDVAILTSVGIDHTNWLGTTIEAIGREKAGIFRRGRCAISSSQMPPNSVISYAEELDTPLLINGRDFSIEECAGGLLWHVNDCLIGTVPNAPLKGKHQLANVAGVLTALHYSGLDLQMADYQLGLKQVRLMGRFQRISIEPTIIVDVAHNPQAAQALSSTLAAYPQRTVVVLGMYIDKDLLGFMAAMDSVVDEWHLGGLRPPRGASISDLKRVVGGGSSCTPIYYHVDVEAAYNTALDQISHDTRIVVTGSFETVAIAIRAAGKVNIL